MSLSSIVGMQQQSPASATTCAAVAKVQGKVELQVGTAVLNERLESSQPRPRPQSARGRQQHQESSAIHIPIVRELSPPSRPESPAHDPQEVKDWAKYQLDESPVTTGRVRPTSAFVPGRRADARGQKKPSARTGMPASVVHISSLTSGFKPKKKPKAKGKAASGSTRTRRPSTATGRINGQLQDGIEVVSASVDDRIDLIGDDDDLVVDDEDGVIEDDGDSGEDVEAEIERLCRSSHESPKTRESQQSLLSSHEKTSLTNSAHKRPKSARIASSVTDGGDGSNGDGLVHVRHNRSKALAKKRPQSAKEANSSSEPLSVIRSDSAMRRPIPKRKELQTPRSAAGYRLDLHRMKPREDGEMLMEVNVAAAQKAKERIRPRPQSARSSKSSNRMYKDLEPHTSPRVRRPGSAPRPGFGGGYMHRTSYQKQPKPTLPRPTQVRPKPPCAPRPQDPGRCKRPMSARVTPKEVREIRQNLKDYGSELGAWETQGPSDGRFSPEGRMTELSMDNNDRVTISVDEADGGCGAGEADEKKVRVDDAAPTSAVSPGRNNSPSDTLAHNLISSFRVTVVKKPVAALPTTPIDDNATTNNNTNNNNDRTAPRRSSTNLGRSVPVSTRDVAKLRDGLRSSRSIRHPKVASKLKLLTRYSPGAGVRNGAMMLHLSTGKSVRRPVSARSQKETDRWISNPTKGPQSYIWTTEAVTNRLEAMQSPLVREYIDRLWHLAGVAEGKSMDFTSFHSINKKIYDCLVPTSSDWHDANAADQSIEDDWNVDREGHYVSYPAFTNSIFDLLDAWVDTTGLQSYTTFLQDTLRHLSGGNETSQHTTPFIFKPLLTKNREQQSVGGPAVTDEALLSSGKTREDLNAPEPLPSLKRTFSKCDVDGDGVISLADIKVVMKSFGLYPPQQQLRDILKAVDHDEDGVIDFEEFARMRWRRDHSLMNVVAEFVKFNIHPLHRGFITRDSVRKVYQAEGFKDDALAAAVEKFFRADGDLDGKVSFRDLYERMTETVNNEWLGWIAENLRKGASVKSLLHSLQMDGGYRHEVSVRAVCVVLKSIAPNASVQQELATLNSMNYLSLYRNHLHAVK